MLSAPRHHLARAGAAVVAALVVTVALAAPARAVEAGSLRLDANVESALGAGPAFTPALAPGTAATYAITVRNDHAVEVEVLLYGADVTETADGAEVGSGVDNDGVGRWITAAEPRLVLGPGETVVTSFTVTRPDDDGEGGVGAIVTQLSEDSREAVGEDPVQRAAVLVRVDGDGRGHGLHVRIAEVARSGRFLVRDVTYRVTLTNPSNETVTPSTSIVSGARIDVREERLLGGLLALRAMRDDFSLAPIGPGDEVTDEFTLSVPVLGAWDTVVAEAATSQVGSRSTALRVVVVQPPLVVLLVLAAAVGVLREWRRHGRGTASRPKGRRRRDASEPDAEDAADAADDDAEGAEDVDDHATLDDEDDGSAVVATQDEPAGSAQ